MENILSENGNEAQERFVGRLKMLLAHGEFEKFHHELNTLSMWGGAGAVWEVYIEDKVRNSKFEHAIVELINLMENSQRIGRNLKSIRRMFRTNRGSSVKWSTHGQPISFSDENEDQ